MTTQSETLYQTPLLWRITGRGDALSLSLPATRGAEPLPDELLAALHRAAFAERGEAGERGKATAGMLPPLPVTAAEERLRAP